MVTTSFVRRYVILLLLIPLGYLVQVCVIPYVRIFDVAPNLLYAIIAIVTVAYGKLQAFWVGVCYGLLLQVMCPSVSYLNLAIYTITALFCSFPFADRPLKSIEYDRALARKRKEMPAPVRTVLCAFLNILIYETVQVTYIYIGGSPLTVGHFLRAGIDIVTTCLLTALLMFPLRRLILGRRIDTPEVTIAPVVFKAR